MNMKITVTKDGQSHYLFYGEPDYEKQVLTQIFLWDDRFKQKITNVRKKLGFDRHQSKPLSDSKNRVETYKKIIREADFIIGYYGLDLSWRDIFYQLITANYIYKPTETITLRDDKDTVSIVIQGHIKSKGVIKSWIDENWEEVEQLVNSKFKKTLERIPKFDKLEHYKKIVELRETLDNGKQLPFRKVVDKLLEEFPELNTADAKVNESSVKNAYHIFKKALTILR